MTRHSCTYLPERPPCVFTSCVAHASPANGLPLPLSPDEVAEASVHIEECHRKSLDLVANLVTGCAQLDLEKIPLFRITVEQIEARGC